MKLVKKVLLASIGILGFVTAEAQTNALVSSMTYPAGASGSGKIGNYVTVRSGSNQDISVTVWDNRLGWRDNGTGSVGVVGLSMTANDPDVALSYDGNCAIVVYENNNKIYVERFGFSGSSFVPTSGPILVSTGPNNKRPNIDAGTGGKTAVSWFGGAFGNMSAFTRGLEICGTSMGPIVDISAPHGFPHSTSPDIAVYEGPSGTVYQYAYKTMNGGNEQLVHLIEQEGTIWGGATSPIYGAILVSGPNGTVNEPRIATQAFTGAPDPDAAVIAYIDGSVAGKYHVKTVHAAAGISDLTIPLSAYNCGNKAPAITWTQCGTYVVSWGHANGGTCGTSQPNSNILSRMVNPVGQPVSNLQWANQSLTGTKFQSAVSARYSADPVIYTSFTDFGSNTAHYKISKCGGSPFMREAEVNVANDVLIYPNPATDYVQIEGQELTEVRVYNMTGQVMYSEKLNNDNNVKVDLSHLAKGLYVLEVHGKDFSHKEKINLQ